MLYGGVADLRKMPRTLIDEGMLRQVYHYRPVGTTKTTGDPVLLVTPLAAPSICFDLRRGCSLVERLVTQGRSTYLVEYGEVSFRDRSEEHTSELQSLMRISYAVFCLKKKKTKD